MGCRSCTHGHRDNGDIQFANLCTCPCPGGNSNYIPLIFLRFGLVFLLCCAIIPLNSSSLCCSYFPSCLICSQCVRSLSCFFFGGGASLFFIFRFNASFPPLSLFSSSFLSLICFLISLSHFSSSLSPVIVVPYFHLSLLTSSCCVCLSCFHISFSFNFFAFTSDFSFFFIFIFFHSFLPFNLQNSTCVYLRYPLISSHFNSSLSPLIFSPHSHLSSF